MAQGFALPINSFANYAISSSCGSNGAGTATTPTQITNLSATITTTGNPVEVSLIPDGSANNAYLDASIGSGNMTIYFYRDGTLIGQMYGMNSIGATVAPNSVGAFDPGAAPGTHTYTASYSMNAATGTVAYCKLLVVEQQAGAKVGVNGFGTFTQITVSTTTTLSNVAYGKQVVLSGSTAYAVTLPSAAAGAGSYIAFQCLTSSFALVTLTPASGTIQNQSTYILGSGESCWLYSDGTNWWVQNSSVMPVAMAAHLGTNQSISSAVQTKILINNVEYDIGSFYDNLTNYRYTPKYPGKYQIDYLFAGNCSAGNNLGMIFKNGTIVSSTIQGTSSSNNGCSTPQGITMNGSTDYVEFWGLADSSAGTVYGNQGAQGNFTRVSVNRVSNI